MSRLFFVTMIAIACGFLGCNDNKPPPDSPDDAQGDLSDSKGADAGADTSNPPPPANTDEFSGGDGGSLNLPSLVCFTPTGMVNVVPGTTVTMVPGAHCSASPPTPSLKAGDGSMSSVSMRAGGDLVFSPPQGKDGKPSCEVIPVKTNFSYDANTSYSLSFKVRNAMCDG